MAKTPKKLNAMRLLEKYGVEYAVIEFPTEIHSAVGVAETAGFSPEQVFKTLVVKRPAVTPPRSPLLVMIPGPASLDLKALARAIGEKKLQMAAHTEAETLTGLQVGGIGALALINKNWDCVLDESARSFDTIVVSAGQRGVNLKVPVQALIDILGAKVTAVTQPDDQ